MKVPGRFGVWGYNFQNARFASTGAPRGGGGHGGRRGGGRKVRRVVGAFRERGEVRNWSCRVTEKSPPFDIRKRRERRGGNLAY